MAKYKVEISGLNTNLLNSLPNQKTIDLIKELVNALLWRNVVDGSFPKIKNWFSFVVFKQQKARISQDFRAA